MKLEIKTVSDILNRTAPGTLLRITGPGRHHVVELERDGYTLRDPEDGRTYSELNYAEVYDFAFEKAGVTIWIGVE